MRSLFLSQRPELVMITSSAQRGPENKLEEEGALNLRERVYCGVAACGWIVAKGSRSKVGACACLRAEKINKR